MPTNRVTVNQYDLTLVEEKETTPLCLIVISSSRILSPHLSRDCGDSVPKIETVLTENERRKYQQLIGERRQKEFWHGRFAGKKAALALDPQLRLGGIEIDNDLRGKPYFSKIARPFGLSISHDANAVAAIVFSDSLSLGLDIETIDPRNIEALRSETRPSDKELTSNALASFDELSLLTLIWSAKEAYTKALGTGLATPFNEIEIASVESISQNQFRFHFTGGEKISVQTWIDGYQILSVALPQTSQLKWTDDKSC